MEKKNYDPIGRLMGLRYKSHPWHGIDIGDKAPQQLTVFIEMVPTDTVKYEVDKPSGYLKIDRPQRYSSILPALYGFIPQTYCDEHLAEKSREVLGRPEIIGDHDPLDIVVLTEKEISHGDLLAQARPIGGLRMIDDNEADDKIIAVLVRDAVYGNYEDVADVPKSVIERLRHYFLTYKDMPGEHRNCEITHIYGAEEARDVVSRAIKDYKIFVEKILFQ